MFGTIFHHGKRLYYLGCYRTCSSYEGCYEDKTDFRCHVQIHMGAKHPEFSEPLPIVPTPPTCSSTCPWIQHLVRVNRRIYSKVVLFPLKKHDQRWMFTRGEEPWTCTYGLVLLRSRKKIRAVARNSHTPQQVYDGHVKWSNSC